MKMGRKLASCFLDCCFFMLINDIFRGCYGMIKLDGALLVVIIERMLAPSMANLLPQQCVILLQLLSSTNVVEDCKEERSS